MKRRGARKKKCKNKKTDKSLLSLCDLGKQKNKLHFCVMAPRVKIDIGSHSVLFVCEYVDIGSINSHKRAGEVHRPTFQPFILASFVFCYTCVCCLSILLGGIDCYYSKQHYLY